MSVDSCMLFILTQERRKHIAIHNKHPRSLEAIAVFVVLVQKKKNNIHLLNEI